MTITYLNSELGFVKSCSVAEGNKARVISLSLNAAKYASYTALMSVTNAGSTTNPIYGCCFNLSDLSFCMSVDALHTHEDMIGETSLNLRLVQLDSTAQLYGPVSVMGRVYRQV